MTTVRKKMKCRCRVCSLHRLYLLKIIPCIQGHPKQLTSRSVKLKELEMVWYLVPWWWTLSVTLKRACYSKLPASNCGGLVSVGTSIETTQLLLLLSREFTRLVAQDLLIRFSLDYLRLDTDCLYKVWVLYHRPMTRSLYSRPHSWFEEFFGKLKLLKCQPGIFWSENDALRKRVGTL